MLAAKRQTCAAIDMIDTICLQRIIQHLSPNLEGSN